MPEAVLFIAQLRVRHLFPGRCLLVGLMPALSYTFQVIWDKGHAGASVPPSVHRSRFCTDYRSPKFSDFSPL